VLSVHREKMETKEINFIEQVTITYALKGRILILLFPDLVA
jgi:hypothetical protein